ncbi:MAG: ABC transporter permease [Streptococcaceae bacterium]|jgi:ABC-type transport system involved in multi-copper enzyme maturation permease subunit|nr:ABC transporter permease [Streptococcaceae bacterium]
MNASNIFKMEFYKNFRDRVWIIITGILTVASLLTTILGIMTATAFSNNNQAEFTLSTVLVMLFGTFVFFTIVALYAFSVAYPYHLLSQDYSNRALGLMIASGVNRSSYYFMKVLATILSTLLALAIILIIPLILVLGFYFQPVTTALSQFFSGITLPLALFYLVSYIIGQLAAVALMFWCVIMARGKFWAIFVFFGISMGAGVITSIITTTFIGITTTANSASDIPTYGSAVINILIGLVELVLYALIGFFQIRRQDL